MLPATDWLEPPDVDPWSEPEGCERDVLEVLSMGGTSEEQLWDGTGRKRGVKPSSEGEGDGRLAGAARWEEG